MKTHWLRQTLSLASLTFALLLTASVAQAAGSKAKEKPKNPAEVAFNKGVEQMKAGSWERAGNYFAAVLEINEEMAEAHNNLAYCARKLGSENYDKALRHYNRALELDPKLAQAYHYRGVLHVLSGDEAAAKADHKSLVDLDRELADELMKVIASGEEPDGHGGAVTSWN